MSAKKEMPFKTDEIIILAKGESKRDCPYDTEVWGVKDVGSYPECAGKRMDYIFDFEPRDPPYRKRLPNIPIVSYHDFADIYYPLEEIQEFFGVDGKEETYFTNTVCYQIALALYLGIKKIKIYGADAPFGYPYFLEKAGIEYWLGRAKQFGAEVEISKGSHLLRTKDGQIYGLPHAGTVLLYLSERLALLQMLPIKGRREDIYISHLLRAVLSVTVDEAERHDVNVQQFTDGRVSYSCDHEFAKEIWLPEWGWHYLRNMLKSMETSGNLVQTAMAPYDKIVNYGRADEEYYRPTRVSFILTTKNRAEFLGKALSNMKEILTEDDELIVVDGDSTDETIQVINSFGKIISKVISREDISPAQAFNRGVLISKGVYVVQCCDDDSLYKDGVEQAIKCMEANPEIDLLVCSGIKVSAGGEGKVFMPPDYGKSCDDVFMYGACGNGFIYRRDLFSKIGLLNTTHRIPDQEFALRAISESRVMTLPITFYRHLVYHHSTSIQNPAQWKEQHKDLIEKYGSRRIKRQLWLQSLRPKWLSRLATGLFIPKMKKPI